MRDIACRDCVVSVLIQVPPAHDREELSAEGSEIDYEQARVIDLLASRGMIPPLRYAQNGRVEGNSQDSEALSG